MASVNEESLVAETGYKYVPVTSESCTGCGLCVAACPHDCLEMVWEFAKLAQADTCVSEGACVEVCPTDVIKMGWKKMNGNQEVGAWQEEAPAAAPARTWLGQILQRCRSRQG